MYNVQVVTAESDYVKIGIITLRTELYMNSESTSILCMLHMYTCGSNAMYVSTMYEQ